MVDLYYALLVAYINSVGELSEPRAFRKPMNLPFPSPIGAKFHVDAQSGYFTKVGMHVHENGRSVNVFYALLVPIEHKFMLMLPEVGHVPAYMCFGSEKQTSTECGCLLQNNWEEIPAEELLGYTHY